MHPLFVLYLCANNSLLLQYEFRKVYVSCQLVFLIFWTVFRLSEMFFFDYNQVYLKSRGYKTKNTILKRINSCP